MFDYSINNNLFKIMFRTDEEGELRKALVDKMDYEVVPAECWNLLVQWYGLYKNQQPVSRKVRFWSCYINEAS